MALTRIASNLVLVVTLVGVAALIAGFVAERWLLADFTVPMNGSTLTEFRPIEVFALVPLAARTFFNESTFVFNITSKMGLFKNCKDSSADIMGESLQERICDAKGAKFWQKLAFALAAGSLLFGAVSLIMTGMGAILNRFITNIRFRFAIVVFNVLTCVFALAPVIMYIRNKKIQVKPPLPIFVDFEPGWALHLTLASAGIFVFIFLMNTFVLMLMGRINKRVADFPESNELSSRIPDNKFNQVVRL